MAQNVVIKATGLHSNNNPYSATPNGSMSKAVNVVIDRTEVVEPRRGFFQYSGTLSDTVEQLINYKDRVLAHVGNTLLFDSNLEGDFVAFGGDAVTAVDDTMKVRSIESNGNLYFTTLNGIKKISARSARDFNNVNVEAAGMAKAVNLNASANYTSVGFLDPNSKVSYRGIFIREDLNENLLSGSPSPIVTVYNLSETQSCTVDLEFDLPFDVVEGDSYQIYRTAMSTDTYPSEPTDPGDEMYLVLEDVITATDISNGSISVEDITPDDFRRSGTLLYTNPVSGEGIAQANEKPPFAKDICVYKGFTWLANTSTVQRLNLDVVSIDSLVTSTSTFSITDGVTTTSYTFRGTNETLTVSYTATEGNFYNGSPATAKYFKLHSAMDERKYVVWFKRNATNDLAPVVSGYINIEVDITASPATADDYMTLAVTAINDFTDDFNLTLNTGTNELTAECSNNGDVSTITGGSTITGTTVTQDGVGTGEDVAGNFIFLPRVPSIGENGPTTAQQLEQIAKSMVKVITSEDALVNAFYISSFDDVPGQIMFEHKNTTGDAFWINSNASSDTFNPTVPAVDATVISTNEVRPNRLYYSKYQQPDSFPLVNYLDVGAKDREIKRIIPLRDSLFILKEDGIYKLTGDTAVAGTNNFNIVEFDFSVQVLAPNSAVVLNNMIYALATQGVISISDTTVSIVSRPIENLILRIIKAGTNYKDASFGVAYETDRSYLLFTVTESTDLVPTQVFRYNTFTNTWTSWDISKNCGIVNFADDKLYLGATDVNVIDRERKNLTRTDHADREYNTTINSLANGRFKVGSLSGIHVGDVLLQRQYLTNSQFNRLLTKLDGDNGVNDSDYLSTLESGQASNIRSLLVSLATKLDTDTGVTDTDYASTIASVSDTATAISVASQTVLTVGTHSFEVGRWVTVSGSNCFPTIDGIREVVSVGATTITLDVEVIEAGTSANLITPVNDFRDVQGCFNLLVNKLNSDAGVSFSNAEESSGYYDFESVITNKYLQTNEITVDNSLEYLLGDVTIFDLIESTVVYNPQFFGDPSIEKQVSEGTLMFENSNFTDAIVSYASDKSPAFVEVEFTKAGVGDFGYASFGEGNFGGINAPIPLRTYIPLEKQRCRYISVKFNHKVALQKYNLFGLSLKFRPYNTRIAR